MPAHNEPDPVARLAAIRQRCGDRIKSTPEYLERRKKFFAGEIEDGRVFCDMCGKYRPFDKYNKCPEKMGCAPDLKRWCIRWIPIQGFE